MKIPSLVTLLSVTAHVLAPITGPQSWKLDTNRGADRFGSGLGLAKDTSVNGPSDPPQVYWREEDITLTATDGTFTAGRIAVAVHFIRLPAPTSS